MKKKYLNISLIVILVIVYGSVIKKCAGFGDSTPDTVLVTTSTPNYIKDAFEVKDTFNLNLNKRDPFDSSNRKFKYVSNKTEESKKPQVYSKKPVDKNLSWPTISYHGFVKSSRNATKLAIIKINNKLYRKREKENFENIKIVKAYKDSVIVSFNKELKTIKRKNE